MSGPICPDCIMFDIEPYTDDSGNRRNRCTFCGWQGDALPRKSLSQEQLRSYGVEQRRMREQRDEGKLFFVRIFVESEDVLEEELDLCESLMEHLDLETLNGPYHDPPYFFNKVQKRPSKRILKRIMALPGVVDITVL